MVARHAVRIPARRCRLEVAQFVEHVGEQRTVVGDQHAVGVGGNDRFELPAEFVPAHGAVERRLFRRILHIGGGQQAGPVVDDADQQEIDEQRDQQQALLFPLDQPGDGGDGGGGEGRSRPVGIGAAFERLG